MAPEQAPLNVFLVEDIEVIRDSLIVALAEVAHATVIASAQDEVGAIEWLRDHPDAWQIAVVDLFLKRGSGLGVLKACHGRTARQRVVVLTNYATPAIRQRCLQAGADVVFDKSTELDAFLEYCSPGGI